jgi:hypothetical protein
VAVAVLRVRKETPFPPSSVTTRSSRCATVKLQDLPFDVNSKNQGGWGNEATGRKKTNTATRVH